MEWYKIVVLIFSFILIHHPCYGQDYFPLQEGNVWYFTAIPAFVEGKVIIDSVEYKKFSIIGFPIF